MAEVRDSIEYIFWTLYKIGKYIQLPKTCYNGLHDG